MLGFLKKLFGLEAEKTVEAPYKVEAPVADVVHPQITDAVTVSAPVAETKPATPAKEAPKRGPRKKPAGQKPAGQKPVVQKPAGAPKQGAGRGRKPKQAK